MNKCSIQIFYWRQNSLFLKSKDFPTIPEHFPGIGCTYYIGVRLAVFFKPARHDLYTILSNPKKRFRLYER